MGGGNRNKSVLFCLFVFVFLKPHMGDRYQNYLMKYLKSFFSLEQEKVLEG